MSKVVFYLMNEKGFFVLKNFLREFKSQWIEYIVLAKDRGLKKDYYDELYDLCKSYNIKSYYRTNKIPSFKGYKFAIGWRWIIKDTSNLIILHDSILPRYRGFAPLVNMLINGEQELGVTALFATEEYDKGDVIKNEIITIEYPIKIQAAIEKIMPLYFKLVKDITELIIQEKVIYGISQDERKATYSVWRDENDYLIDWSKDANYIRRVVDSLGFPYSGARTSLNGDIIIIDEVEEFMDLKLENRDIGKVILVEKNFPVVICGKGLIKVKKARNLKGEFVIPLMKFRSRFGG